MIRVARGGGLAELYVRTATPLAPVIESCLRQRIDAALVHAATPAGDLTIDLRVWLRP